jgi:hypothetical protein
MGVWPPLVGVVGVAARGVVKDTAGYNILNTSKLKVPLDLLFKVEEINLEAAGVKKCYVDMGRNSKVAPIEV